MDNDQDPRNRKSIYIQPTGDDEIDAIRLCQLALNTLHPNTQLRVIQFLDSRARGALFPQFEPKPASDTDAKPFNQQDKQ